jgi:hypothetical protein
VVNDRWEREMEEGELESPARKRRAELSIDDRLSPIRINKHIRGRAPLSPSDITMVGAGTQSGLKGAGWIRRR